MTSPFDSQAIRTLEDKNAELKRVLGLVLKAGTYPDGQHELETCRFCHARQLYGPPWTLTHKPGCVYPIAREAYLRE